MTLDKYSSIICWNVSSVNDMNYMFMNAYVFNNKDYLLNWYICNISGFSETYEIHVPQNKN